jgi:predicted TIM-barrel fold metal-dependent hydrolase
LDTDGDLLSLQKTMADLQVMVAQHEAALAKEKADRNAALAREKADRNAEMAKEKADRNAEMAREKADRKAEMAKEKADRKAETALRIAEINRLEQQLENQRDENNQLLEDLQSKQRKILKQMKEHAADMKYISEVRNLRNYYTQLLLYQESDSESLAHSEVDPSPSPRPSRLRSPESPDHHGV